MARLTAKARKSLKPSQFALPGKGAGLEGKGPGSYPVPDKRHARIALSLVSQHGSPAQKAKVRAKVRSKFPAIGSNRPGNVLGK
jgi:hypothetical protein